MQTKGSIVNKYKYRYCLYSNYTQMTISNIFTRLHLILFSFIFYHFFGYFPFYIFFILVSFDVCVCMYVCVLVYIKSLLIQSYINNNVPRARRVSFYHLLYFYSVSSISLFRRSPPSFSISLPKSLKVLHREFHEHCETNFCE